MSVRKAKEKAYTEIDRFRDEIPPHTDEAKERLKTSIQAVGLLSPTIWVMHPEAGTMEIIDGRCREAICKELGIEPLRKFIHASTSDEELMQIRIVSSIDWRGRSRREYVLHFFEKHEAAGMSPAVIAAKITGMFGISVSGQTVRNVREELIEGGRIVVPELAVGTDGRFRPTTRPQQRRTRPPMATFRPAQPVGGISHVDRDEWARTLGVNLSFLQNETSDEAPADTPGMLATLNGLRGCLQELLDRKRPDADDAEQIATRGIELGQCLAQADGIRSKHLTNMFRGTLNILFANAQDLINEVNRLRQNGTENNN